MLWFILSLCLVFGWAVWGWAALESNVKLSKWDMMVKRPIAWLREFVHTHPLIIVGVISLVVALIGHYSLYDGVDTWKFTQDFYSNYFAEIVGIVVTVYLIDRLNQIRDERREAQMEKERLIVQTRSVDKNEAVLAIRMLGQREWLPDVNFQYMNLEGCDLSIANLSRTNLIRINLSDADLSAANLSRADLSGANLSGANLSGANLSGANLSGANLSRASYDSGTQWPEGFNFRESGAFGPQANLSGANLRGANLSRANLRGANLRGADLRGADLRGADLRGADLSRASLREANLWEANLSRANLSGADLWEANLSGADLSGADLREAFINRTELREANLSGANLSGANLREANLWEARYDSDTCWPNGFDPPSSSRGH